MKTVPRWQQGLRPHAYSDVWDAMSPEERRSAFIGDLAICAFAVAMIALASFTCTL